MEGVRRDGGQDQYCAVFVSWWGWYQVTVSFRLPPLQPSSVSWTIKQHARTHGTRVRARRAGDGSLERPLIIVCNAIRQQLMNLQWCTYIGRYNSSQYDSIRYTQYRFQYATDPIIVRSLVCISWNSEPRPLHSESMTCYSYAATVLNGCQSGSKSVRSGCKALQKLLTFHVNRDCSDIFVKYTYIFSLVIALLFLLLHHY